MAYTEPGMINKKFIKLNYNISEIQCFLVLTFNAMAIRD